MHIATIVELCYIKHQRVLQTYAQPRSQAPLVGRAWKPKQHLRIIGQCDGWVDQSLLASVSYIVYHISADLCHIVYHISADLCHISVEMAQVSTNMVHQRMPYIGYTSQQCLRSTHTSCYNYTYRVVCTLQQHNHYDYVLHVRNSYSRFRVDNKYALSDHATYSIQLCLHLFGLNL